MTLAIPGGIFLSFRTYQLALVIHNEQTAAVIKVKLQNIYLAVLQDARRIATLGFSRK